MRTYERPVYIFHSLLFNQCAPPNVPFRYSNPRYLHNATLQTSRLANTFHAIYPMRPSKRPVWLFHSPLFTQCAAPNVPFTYYIPRYLPNAPHQTSRLDISVHAIYTIRYSKRKI